LEETSQGIRRFLRLRCYPVKRDSRAGFRLLRWHLSVARISLEAFLPSRWERLELSLEHKVELGLE